MSFIALPWLGILAGTVATFFLGGLWYSPLLFGRAWQRLNGLDDAALAHGMGAVFGGAFVCAFISAITMAFFLGPDATPAFGAAAGAATGVGWVAPGLVTTFLFERRPGALIAIDAGYHAVSFTVMGLLVASL